jgi:hypothetical protein
LTAAIVGTPDAADERRQVGELGRAEIAQVEPGTERRIGAGDDDAPSVLARGDGVDEGAGELDVDGIAGRRPVQGDDRDGVTALDDHGRLGHGSPLGSRAGGPRSDPSDWARRGRRPP